MFGIKDTFSLNCSSFNIIIGMTAYFNKLLSLKFLKINLIKGGELLVNCDEHHYFLGFQSSFHALKTWIRELDRFGPSDILIAIAGNKCDKADQREVS